MNLLLYLERKAMSEQSVEHTANKQPVAATSYEDDDLVMISALQHYLFCPRQCALIHVEQQWLENRLTAEGRILHERVHGGGR